MIWSLLKFRKSQGAVADTTMVHNTKVEVVWTADPGGDPGRDGRAGREHARRSWKTPATPSSPSR